MNNPLNYIKDLLKSEPALVSWAVNGGIAALCAFILHFGATKEAAVATIVTGLSALVTAYATRPVNVSVVSGAITTLATAVAAFGLHIAPGTTAFLVTLVSALTGLLVRGHVSPAGKAS
jgi:hypothetical protein